MFFLFLPGNKQIKHNDKAYGNKFWGQHTANFKFCQVRGKTIIFNNHHLVEIKYILTRIEEGFNLGITPWSLH